MDVIIVLFCRFIVTGASPATIFDEWNNIFFDKLQEQQHQQQQQPRFIGSEFYDVARYEILRKKDDKNFKY